MIEINGILKAVYITYWEAATDLCTVRELLTGEEHIVPFSSFKKL